MAAGDPQIGADGFPFWEKDPEANKDYTLDWSTRFPSDPLATSAWVVGTGLTGGSQAFNANAETATIWLSGGTAGRRYFVTNHVTTAGGRADDQSFWIVVKPK